MLIDRLANTSETRFTALKERSGNGFTEAPQKDE